MSGLASVTLARLYLQQGHAERARAVLDTILARDPLDGGALALRARLEQCSRARVTVEARAGAVRIRWSRARWPGDCVHAVVVVFSRAPPHTARVTSRRCLRTEGAAVLPCPGDPGSACARLVAANASGLRTLAVAEPATWP